MEKEHTWERVASNNPQVGKIDPTVPPTPYVLSPHDLLESGKKKQHKHKLFGPDFPRTFLTLTPGRPWVKKFLPITGAAEKRTFWCGRPRFLARTSMTRRVLEKLCTKKVCVDFFAPCSKPLARGVLLVGRILGGFATSLLFSVFESWVVSEMTQTHKARRSWRGRAFSFLRSADCKRGRRKGATSKNVKNRQKVSKGFSTLFDNFRAGQKTSKIVKKCQKVFRHFSTIFARHLFSGPFCNPMVRKKGLKRRPSGSCPRNIQKSSN